MVDATYAHMCTRTQAPHLSLARVHTHVTCEAYTNICAECSSISDNFGFQVGGVSKTQIIIDYRVSNLLGQAKVTPSG